ncbi:hypothetical protein F5Y19DRAFT_216133 [Xylariaceae sp. FL1651]|nr:hypothetical protein F5Y19DRAFT_216133 [Xylariaceae sp. FL1651]
MGGKVSKPAQTAARRFPTRAPGSSAVPPSTAHQPAPRSGGGALHARRPEPRAAKDDAIHADGRDPDFDLDAGTNAAFSERLRKMGVATPHPTLSRSSTAGPFASPPSSSSTAAPPSSTTVQTSSSLSPPSSSPSQSPSSSTNTNATTTAYYPPPSQNRTLNALEARRDLQARAQAEFEDPSAGREFLDAAMLRQVLLLRARGVAARDIEARFRLKSGVVARLGPPGVAVPVQGAVNKQTWGGLQE